ncbi:hypothetical protein HanRHA438_Chr15g0698851 [Helianthus annuus]|nr:hypothetical protein HanRHA438_Chr15g0698851 [Helianthus annuus]
MSLVLLCFSTLIKKESLFALVDFKLFAWDTLDCDDGNGKQWHEHHGRAIE